MARKIKECPFCGSAGVVVKEHNWYRVECSETKMCHLSPHTHWNEDPNKSISKWNKRSGY